MLAGPSTDSFVPTTLTKIVLVIEPTFAVTSKSLFCFEPGVKLAVLTTPVLDGGVVIVPPLSTLNVTISSVSVLLFLSFTTADKTTA